MDSKPKLYVDLQPVWGAFWQLNAARDQGMSGPQAIKISEMKSYLDLFGGFSAEYFYSCMSALDIEYLNWVSKKREEDDNIEEGQVKQGSVNSGKRHNNKHNAGHQRGQTGSGRNKSRS